MTQFVDQPTCFKARSTGNILDIICSNDGLSTNIINYLPPLSTSDHVNINFYVSTPPPLTANCVNSPRSGLVLNQASYKLIYDWKAADYKKINECIQYFDWNTFYSQNLTVEALWDEFKRVIWSIISAYVPSRQGRSSKKSRPNKYPKRIRNLLSRKSIIWRKLKLHPTCLSLRKAYGRVANECKLAILKLHSDKEKNARGQ